MSVATARIKMELLARESRVRLGVVPDRLGARLVGPADSWLADGQFMLRTDAGLAFHYRQGDGVTMQRDGAPDPGEESLWLNGSVYAAIACINGLLPIHASAVAWDGKVHAFTGPSGAGKSTLVAALGRSGLPMVADDTLILDISDLAEPICLPGHKRLKLTPEAIALTGAEAAEPVGPFTGKRYAAPAAGDIREPLPLASLFLLEAGERLAPRKLSGAERIGVLNDDHYTSIYYGLANGHDRAARFAALAGLAAKLPLTGLQRRWDPAVVQNDASRLAELIKAGEI